MEKQCNKCMETKPISDFFRKSSNKDGYESQCKKCKDENRKSIHKHTCKQCGNPFTSSSTKSIFCSNECTGISRKNQVSFKCDFCGTLSSDRKSHYDLRTNHYCSQDCMHKHQAIIWKGNGSPLYDRRKIKCDYCKKEFEIPEYSYTQNKHHYCSNECSSKHRSILYRKENHPRWNFDLTQEERELERNYPEYTNFRKEVYERDNYTCRCCSDDKGGNLLVHHLDGYNWYKEGRTDVNNGITLCEKCHKEFHKIYGKGNNTKEQYEEFYNNKTNLKQLNKIS